jgi:competence protein ComEA
VLLTAAAYASAQSLPAGPNQDLVEAVCSACHSTERIAKQHKTKTQWQDKVLEMLQEDPDITQAERDRIVDYLSKAFPARVNVNTAAAADVQTVLELTPEGAASIVQYREKNGAFRSLEDLKKVPGVDAAKLDANKDRVEF